MKKEEQIRQNIRDIREDKKITQALMAEKLGMSETGYAKIERGETQIRIKQLERIAQVLDVSLAELIPLEGTIIFNNSNDNFSNSSNFNLALGDPILQSEITSFK